MRLKNYGDQGGCYRLITSSEISIVLHLIRKRNTIIVLLFIQNHWQFKNIAKTCLPPSMSRSSLIVHVQGCSALQNNFLLIADVALPVVFLLFLPCFQLLFHLVLTLETSEMSAIFVFTTKTTQPCPQVVSVNSALTSKEAALLTSLVD